MKLEHTPIEITRAIDKHMLDLIGDEGSGASPCSADSERINWLASNCGGFAHDEEDRGITTSAWGEWAERNITPDEFRAIIDAARKQQNAAGNQPQV